MSDLDLDIQNYSISDMEKFFIKLMYANMEAEMQVQQTH